MMRRHGSDEGLTSFIGLLESHAWANGEQLWRDPRRGEIRLEKWAAEWIQTRHDLRLTTRTRLEITLKVQVLPRFGTTPLVRITNAAVRSWVAEMRAASLSPLHHPQSCLRASPMSRCGDC